MSLASILSIARSALLAQQRAMTVTSQNIANAQTPGYSRQRLELIAMDPLFTGLGTIGRGVTDAGITRARDQFFDATYRRESGLLGNASLLQDFLGQVEAAVNEPSDTGVAASMDGLFQAFGDLANDPSSGPNRELVRQAAGRFIQQLHRLDGELKQVTSDATDRLTAQVDQVNTLTQRIAALNAQIQAVGGPQHSAPDLEDQRDVLVDQLSSLVSVKVLQRDDGSIGVLAGGTMLVDHATSQELEVKSVAGGGFGVGLTSSSEVADLGAGSLQALSDLTTTTLPGYQSQLDTLANAVVTEFNAVHRNGFTQGGMTGIDFFDPTKTTAASISLSADVAASADAIAASGTGAPGDGSIASQLAALGNNAITSLGGSTMREYYTEFAANIGVAVQNANTDAATQQALVDRADTLRSSVSGVSIEEEMTSLIAQQQAYGAAAHLITVAQQMMDDVLNMI